EHRVAVVFVNAAMEIVIAPARDQSHLDGSLAGGVGGSRSGGHGDFFNRVEARVDRNTKTVALLIGVGLRVDTIDRNVHGADGQPDDRGSSGVGGRVGANQIDDEVSGIAGNQR